MIKTYDVVVAGGGFAGIYASWRLARAGKSVALVESTGGIGGNLQSRFWNGFWLDHGTHNFDFRTPLGQDFYQDILQDEMMVFEDQPWACTTDKSWTYGFEVPDFAVDDPDFCNIALREMASLLAAESQSVQPDRYLDYYRRRFGHSLTDRLIPAIRKYTGSDPEDFSVDAIGSMGMFQRVKLGTDSEMIKLKEQEAFWDDRLGVTLASGDVRYLGRNVHKRFAYPRFEALNGFCKAAHRRLTQIGVEILLGNGVSRIGNEADGLRIHAGSSELVTRKLFWSLPESILARILGIEIDLGKFSVPVGNAFFAFEVSADSILGPDYLQDYSTRRQPFRYNRQGVYSNQIKSDGRTFIVAEMPCNPKDIASRCSQTVAEQVWHDVLDVGFVKPSTKFTASEFWGHPVAFSIPKVGWKGPYLEFREKLREYSAAVHCIDFGYRGRLSFMIFYDEQLRGRLES